MLLIKPRSYLWSYKIFIFGKVFPHNTNYIVQSRCHIYMILHNTTYKNYFHSPSFDFNFLIAKITKNGKLRPPKKQTKVLGISSQKKANIIKNLSGIVKNRLQFWETLPVSDENWTFMFFFLYSSLLLGLFPVSINMNYFLKNSINIPQI